MSVDLVGWEESRLTVNSIVHGDEVQPVGGLLVVRVPAVQQHRHVVIPVEEDERLLAEHDEDCVAQLRNLKKKARRSGQIRENAQDNRERDRQTDGGMSICLAGAGPPFSVQKQRVTRAIEETKRKIRPGRFCPVHGAPHPTPVPDPLLPRCCVVAPRPPTHLGKNEHLSPESDRPRAVPHGRLGADGVLEAVDGEDVDQVRDSAEMRTSRLHACVNTQRRKPNKSEREREGEGEGVGTSVT